MKIAYRPNVKTTGQIFFRTFTRTLTHLSSFYGMFWGWVHFFQTRGASAKMCAVCCRRTHIQLILLTVMYCVLVGVTQGMINELRVADEQKMLRDLQRRLRRGSDLEFRGHRGETPVFARRHVNSVYRSMRDVVYLFFCLYVWPSVCYVPVINVTMESSGNFDIGCLNIFPMSHMTACGSSQDTTPR